MRAVLKAFFNSEKAGGLLLVCCTVISLVLANSFLVDEYLGLWNLGFAGHSINHWINDGLMAIFFLLVGLELKREIYSGELSSFKNATFPVFAAIGGMLVPAGIFLLFNYGTPTQRGTGIPMATDIAFAIGILSLLGNRVPASLKILLTAIAVIDDLGAVIMIAVFYTSTLSFFNLGVALAIFGALLVLNRLKINSLFLYLAGGVAMWYFMLHSGVHATLAGVLLAFAIPFGNGGKAAPAYQLQHGLHWPVTFFILPLFALANTCITFEAGWYTGLGEATSTGIIAGLLLGKPLGILLLAFLAVALKFSNMPGDLNWKQVAGVSILAGIGFTMSIFITLLAFDDAADIINSKIAILLASFTAGIVGYIWLNLSLQRIKKPGSAPE